MRHTQVSPHVARKCEREGRPSSWLDRTFGDVLTLVHAFQLTAYDAVYLELARREGLPLATLEKSLRAAAEKAGVQSWGNSSGGEEHPHGCGHHDNEGGPS